MLPQIIILGFSVLQVGLYLGIHGQPKTGEYSFWSALIANAFELSILYWGGFFNGLF